MFELDEMHRDRLVARILLRNKESHTVDLLVVDRRLSCGEDVLSWEFHEGAVQGEDVGPVQVPAGGWAVLATPIQTVERGHLPKDCEVAFQLARGHRRRDTPAAMDSRPTRDHGLPSGSTSSKMKDRRSSSIEEMSQLRDWSVAIVRFIGSIPEAASLSRQMEAVIHQAFESRDLRGLWMVARDVAEWATDLSPEQQQQLDELLVSRFGRGLKDQRKDVEREIARILRRGQIETEDEYRLLMARVDEIYADESKAEELEQINRLVLAFRQDAMGE